MEIERKFLVTSDEYKSLDIEIQRQKIRQGYFGDGFRIRTSINGFGEKGFITFKSANSGISRHEYEYEIPYKDAEEILNNFGKQIIEKIRYQVLYNHEDKWEVDEFHGDNEGLIVAEIELETEDQIFELPSWIGKEVSHERKYYNSDLSKKPFNTW